MTTRFKACDFDEKAMKGAWQALGIASAMPGPRQSKWEEQTDEIVLSAPKLLLDLVTRAFSRALPENYRKSDLVKKANDPESTLNIPMAQAEKMDFSAYPVPENSSAGGARIDIDAIISDMQYGPEVKKAIEDIASNMVHDSKARGPRSSEEEGPGFLGFKTKKGAQRLFCYPFFLIRSRPALVILKNVPMMSCAKPFLTREFTTRMFGLSTVADS